MSLLNELVKAGDVHLKVDYHEELNPKLWEEGDHLKPMVQKHLLEIASMFEESLKAPKLHVVDIIMTGSNANYNWTDISDIDLHLVVDFTDLKENCSDLFKEYVDAKKVIWNAKHDIKIFGYDVEVYVQDHEEAHVSTGIYSVLTRSWIVHPNYNPPDVNDSAVKKKAASLMNRIDSVNGHCSNLAEIEKIRERIKKMRKAGLQKAGEFSTENLVFKTLRNNGYLDKLAELKQEADDDCFSLKADEEEELAKDGRCYPTSYPVQSL